MSGRGAVIDFLTNIARWRFTCVIMRHENTIIGFTIMRISAAIFTLMIAISANAGEFIGLTSEEVQPGQDYNDLIGLAAANARCDA
jgi:hypothetical protein